MSDISKSNNKQEKTTKKNQERKNYHSPHLEIYGILNRITKGGGGIKNEPGGPATPNTRL